MKNILENIKYSKLIKSSLGLVCLIILACTAKSSIAYSNPENAINYNYDSSGRLTSLNTRSGSVSFHYDAQGNLISKSNEGSVNGFYEIRDVSSAIGAYGNIQGNGNWYYQEWNGKEYTNLKYKNGYWEGSNPYTIINKDIHHPAETDSVRTWIAPKSGLIRITGNVAKVDINGGDGVVAKVLKKNIQLWSQIVAYNDSTGYEVGMTVAVNAGDPIYFVINKNGANANDSTSWKPVITYVESQSAYEAYGNIQGNGNWYYQEWNEKEYTDLKYKNGYWEGSSPYTIINKDIHHPAETDSVRTWIAPKSGLIRVTGNVAKSDINGGDGVVAKVLKKDIQLWSQTVAYNDSTGYEVGVTVAVNAGDPIYFVINKNGTNAYDSTSWKPIIAYMESQSAYEAYGNIQGNGNWYYQQLSGTEYSDLKYKNGQWEGSSPYTLIYKDIQHPAEADSVRKWVAPKSGFIRIAGNVAKNNTGGGDGVIVKVLKNNTQLWSQKLEYNNNIGYEVGVTVKVNAADSIYFIVNKNGTNAYDGTSWNPIIAYLERD
jgi:YD repeat-containing protein